MNRLLIGALLAFAPPLGLAVAADAPPPAPVFTKAPAAASGGAYFWADGSYQSVKLPTYALGWSTATRNPIGGALLTNLGSGVQFDPRAAGEGASGGLGYVLPHGTFAPVFGENVRIELGGSYVHATASQSAASGPTAFVLPNAFFLQLLNGTVGIFGACGPGSVNIACSETATLSTSYTAWQGNAKIAGDFKSGPITLTPSAAVFGGDARNNQDLAASLAITDVFGATFTQPYKASTSLRWTDFGGRLGADAKFDFTNWLAVGLGGYVGAADRSVTLGGCDKVNASPCFSIASGANTTALLANAEASITIKPISSVAITAFVGLNYDDRVPGIAAPTFTSPCCLLGTAPATINFQAETSYYAGERASVKF